ncbi:unnamed protein product [Mytilus edulis]|uniref:Uncharacterized protein n=1 Tax=Mytilus edulis TaxID=6550 RepID=A0A8S3TEB8_MYTED|nr:unnamed protein product [Mytilus edulis]
MNNIRKQLSKIEEIPYLNNNLTSVPVILSDSKGRCLQNQLNFRNSIKWCYKSGATTKEQFNFLKQNLAELINQYTNITLFVWLGTNDLTKKERDGSISLKSSGNDSVNHIYSIYKEIYFFVRNFEKVKLIYIEVPVYSIYWWNVFHNHSNPEQFREDDLCLHTQIDIQPNSEIFVRANVPKHLSVGLQGIYTNNVFSLGKGLLLAKALVTVSIDKTIPLKIMNPTNTTISVSKGSTLANFQILNADFSVITEYIKCPPVVQNVRIGSTHPIISTSKNNEFRDETKTVFLSNYSIPEPLNPEQTTQLTDCLYENKDIFVTKENPDLGFSTYSVNMHERNV